MSSISKNNKGVLFGLGNPLLDILSTIDQEFLDKYDLKSNDQILADDKHTNLFDDLVKSYNVLYIPGGSTLNTIRIAQWMFDEPHATSFVGCIGEDNFGKILESKVEEEGVNHSFKKVDSQPTGTCAVCINGKNRSLVALLGAANLFTQDHLDKPDNYKLINDAKFYYIAGYPITVCPDVMLKIGEHASKENKIFCLNLSAPFICSVFKEPLLKLLPYTDILFANEAETLAFSQANGWPLTDLKEIGLKITQLPKQNGSKGRVMIITQGCLPTILIHNGKMKEIQVVSINQDHIVDTNGAGDAFVGGFLSYLCKGYSLECSIDAGHYAAHYIIQKSGVQLSGKSTYKCPGLPQKEISHTYL